MVSNADSDSLADSDPDTDNSSRLTARLRVTHSSQERQSPSGAPGQKAVVLGWNKARLRHDPVL